MKKIALKLFYHALMMLVPLTTFTQSIERNVLSASGFTTSQLDITIGEVFTSTLTTSDIVLSQGFEQGELIDISVDELTDQSVVMLYPNPTRFQFTVTTPGQSSTLEITILDMAGKLVEVIYLYQQPQYIDVTALAAGTYMLNIISQDQKINERHLLIKL